VTRNKNVPLVVTIKDRCRVCYTCVRECPAKAIRIAEGQAEVIPERCIGCGNCVRVCSQKAKQVLSSIDEVLDLLKSSKKVAALVAPSFPAEFAEIEYPQLVGALRALGFDYVNEVAFGADLVALKTREILEQNPTARYISTSCPAVFGYVKRYHFELIPMLLPVVSPMIATARALRALHGDDLKVVFIGPCIAKMGEAYSDEMSGEIDEVLTFAELRSMLSTAQIAWHQVTPSDFDPPYGYKGTVFPIHRGLLATSELQEDLLTEEVVSASGRANFIDAIMEFASGELNARLLDVLACDGCIMGAGMTSSDPLFKRRSRVSRYARQMVKKRNHADWRRSVEKVKNINLFREFVAFNQRIPDPSEEQVRAILAKMGKITAADELNCGACGYDTCREHAIAIYKGLAESEMCLPYTIERLHKTIQDLNLSREQLDATRNALIQAEKIASMGQLAAGIAHEVNNPLGVVLMYAHLLLEQCPIDSELYGDLKMIVEQADRCKKIVSGLLNFARQNKVNYRKVNIPMMLANYLKTVQVPENIKIDVQTELQNPEAEFDLDQIIQVLTNLVNNSITAMPNGGSIVISARDDADRVFLSIADTGCGIPKEYLSKIFEPFFTTKKVGQGTGLGLSITYGIIKMHNGDIKVQSNNDPQQGPSGTTFTITLPRKRPKVVNPITA
jgi:iron only hydrogenase large subunit-like protein/nitrogen-specific signal transduction histidine kinase